MVTLAHRLATLSVRALIPALHHDGLKHLTNRLYQARFALLALTTNWSGSSAGWRLAVAEAAANGPWPRAWLSLSMTSVSGEIGQLRREELPAIRVIVPPDLSGRVFEDDLDPGEVIFDRNLTPMLIWNERYPLGRGHRSGWVLRYDADGDRNLDDYIVGLSLRDVDAAVAQAREYLRAVGYPAAGWLPS
ncbi:MAG: hypothetical protein ABSB76_22520 [Streptosporangiaceae bacterium]